MRTWLREPLLHFAVLGAALFLAYSLLNPAETSSTEIVVSAGQVEALSAQFASTWQRPPTDQELKGLIEGYVRDEVLSREGRALGFDQDDPVIRNRLRQKVEILALEALSPEPTDAELEAYLAAHPERFELPGTATLEQVYFDPTRRGAALERDVTLALASLQRRRAPSGLGDVTMLPPRMSGATPRDVLATFGDEFARAVGDLEVGSWQGPVRSTYGVHLVRVVERRGPTLPTLADARDVVAREWGQQKSVELREQHYRALRSRYTVTVEPVAVSTAQVQTP
jgi:hypothetical protein